ncbi:MAG: SAM-dependent methyltransferase, partial [Pirellulaceae bacterium]|nr:SAM-dependent methyltransferase [Pirellulaceae bacterium]
YQVAHVDAAKPNVQAAGVAAKWNGLQDAPIRYLVDDAAKFVAREVRRQRVYQAIVLDPPAYGHAPTGKAWRIERDLYPLLSDCFDLLDRNRFRVLITGHSAPMGAKEVIGFFQDFWRRQRSIEQTGLRIESGRSQLLDRQKRPLDAGFFVRIEYRSPTHSTN